MDFTAFDTKKTEEYAARAKAAWGETPAYREFEEKQKSRPQAENGELAARMMGIFAEFGAIRQEDPACEKARQLVLKLRDFISAHFYTCTDQILSGLGQMYAGGGDMTENIDRAGGEGTGAFANAAIQAFLAK